MYKIFGILTVFSIILFSCSVGDRIPVAPATHIPLSALWTQVIDRRINYETNSSEIVKDNLKINQEIRYSANASFSKAPKAIIYENYSEPFSFHLTIDLKNKDINKIVFLKCEIQNTSEEIKNILIMPIENINYRFLIHHLNEGWWSSEDKKLSEYNEIKIDKIEGEDIESIRIDFYDIPINYKNDIEIIIKFEFELYFNKDENKIFEFENKYIRKIEELKMYSPLRNNKQEEDWHEISIEDWEKYL